MKKAYLAIDAHARHCVLGSMNSQGKFLGDMHFPTTEADLISQVVKIKAKEKILAIEEGPLKAVPSMRLVRKCQSFGVSFSPDNALVRPVLFV